MAEVVVDILEPVKVDKQNRHAALETTGRQQRLTQAVKEQGAVRQAGQNVMDRKVTHAGFGLFTFGNIGVGRNVTAARHRVVINLNDTTIRAGPFHAIGFTTPGNRNAVGNQCLNADIAVFAAFAVIAQDIGKRGAFLDQIARQVQQFDIAFVPDHQVQVLIEQTDALTDIVKGCFQQGLFALGFFLRLPLKGDHFIIFADQKPEFVRAVPFHRTAQTAVLGHSNGMQQSVEWFLDRAFVGDQKACGHDRDQKPEQDHVDRNTAEQQILNAGVGEVNHQFANVMADVVAFEIDTARKSKRVGQFGLRYAGMGKFGAVCAQCLHGNDVAIARHGV